MLELFGDVGGLLEALKLLGGFVVMPIATFALEAKLLYLIFGQVPIKRKDEAMEKAR